VPPGAVRAGASAAQPRGNGCTSLTLGCDAFCDAALQIMLEEGQYAKRWRTAALAVRLVRVAGAGGAKTGREELLADGWRHP
jgi:hypothetical protein